MSNCPLDSYLSAMYLKYTCIFHRRFNREYPKSNSSFYLFSGPSLLFSFDLRKYSLFQTRDSRIILNTPSLSSIQSLRKYISQLCPLSMSTAVTIISQLDDTIAWVAVPLLPLFCESAAQTVWVLIPEAPSVPLHLAPYSPALSLYLHSPGCCCMLLLCWALSGFRGARSDGFVVPAFKGLVFFVLSVY